VDPGSLWPGKPLLVQGVHKKGTSRQGASLMRYLSPKSLTQAFKSSPLKCFVANAANWESGNELR
jgi:hypothetical protein